MSRFAFRRPVSRGTTPASPGPAQPAGPARPPTSPPRRRIWLLVLAGWLFLLLFFGPGLSGATELAGRMVREFGFSNRLGPVAYPYQATTYLGGRGVDRPYAEATQRQIDTEVERLLREAEHQAVEMVREHRPVLDQLARRLLEEETLDGSVVYELVATEGNQQ